MNVILLSMNRCGMSWVGEVISQIHKRLYGVSLKIIYENNSGLISHNLVDGWHGVYYIDPKVLLKLGYDKIIIIKRELETLYKVHAQYYGFLENYKSLEDMKIKRSGFFERIRLYYKLLYEQDDIINNPKVLIVRLEDLNNYTHSTFDEIIKFLEFDLSLKQKIKLFFRILKNKIYPFVVPVKPLERDWDVYSALLPKGHELCERLKHLQKLKQYEVKE